MCFIAYISIISLSSYVADKIYDIVRLLLLDPPEVIDGAGGEHVVEVIWLEQEVLQVVLVVMTQVVLLEPSYLVSVLLCRERASHIDYYIN